MSKRKMINTTIGDLVAAVTDETRPHVKNKKELYTMVSLVVNDMLARHQPGARKRSQDAMLAAALARTGT